MLTRLVAAQTVAGPQSGTTTKTAKQSSTTNPLERWRADDMLAGSSWPRTESPENKRFMTKSVELWRFVNSGDHQTDLICDQIVNIEDFLLKILAVIPPEIFYSLSRFNTGIVSCIIYKHCPKIRLLISEQLILMYVIFLEVRS